MALWFAATFSSLLFLSSYLIFCVWRNNLQFKSPPPTPRNLPFDVEKAMCVYSCINFTCISRDSSRKEYRCNQQRREHYDRRERGTWRCEKSVEKMTKCDQHSELANIRGGLDAIGLYILFSFADCCVPRCATMKFNLKPRLMAIRTKRQQCDTSTFKFQSTLPTPALYSLVCENEIDATPNHDAKLIHMVNVWFRPFPTIE